MGLSFIFLYVFSISLDPCRIISFIYDPRPRAERLFIQKMNVNVISFISYYLIPFINGSAPLASNFFIIFFYVTYVFKICTNYHYSFVMITTHCLVSCSYLRQGSKKIAKDKKKNRVKLWPVRKKVQHFNKLVFILYNPKSIFFFFFFCENVFPPS